MLTRNYGTTENKLLKGRLVRIFKLTESFNYITHNVLTYRNFSV